MTIRNIIRDVTFYLLVSFYKLNINFTDWVNNEILTAYKQKPELGTVLFGYSGGHKDGH